MKLFYDSDSKNEGNSVTNASDSEDDMPLQHLVNKLNTNVQKYYPLHRYLIYV